MADLTNAQAESTVTLTGASSSGTPTNFVNSDASGSLQNTDITNVTGLNGTLTVGTTAVLAAVGVSNLAVRKSLTVFNNSLVPIYWGYNSSVTTSNGSVINPGLQGIWGAGVNVTVYLIAATASNNVRVTEAS